MRKHNTDLFQKILTVLEQYPGQGFCHRCLELRTSLSIPTLILEEDMRFVREEGRCHNCARERLLTRIKT